MTSYVCSAVGPYHDFLTPDSADYFFVAPFALRVTSGSFQLYSTVTAHAENYLSIALGRRHAGHYAQFVYGVSTPSGPRSWKGNLAFGHSYTWDPSWFDPDLSTLAAGDAVGFSFHINGSASAPKGQVAVTVGFTPR